MRCNLYSINRMMHQATNPVIIIERRGEASRQEKEVTQKLEEEMFWLLGKREPGVATNITRQYISDATSLSSRERTDVLTDGTTRTIASKKEFFATFTK